MKFLKNNPTLDDMLKIDSVFSTVLNMPRDEFITRVLQLYNEDYGQISYEDCAKIIAQRSKEPKGWPEESQDIGSEATEAEVSKIYYAIKTPPDYLTFAQEVIQKHDELEGLADYVTAARIVAAGYAPGVSPETTCPFKNDRRYELPACSQEGCPLWDAEEKKCTIKVIGDSIKELMKKLNQGSIIR